MSEIRNVLANAQVLSVSGTDVPLSEIRGDLAQDVRYDVLVESVSGAPSAAALAARLQRWVPVGGGSTIEAGGQWVDLLDGGNSTFSLTATGTSSFVSSIRYVNSFEVADFAAGGSGVGTVLLRDGSTSGAIYAQIQIPAGTSVGRNWSKPLHFPSGLVLHYTNEGTGIDIRGSVQGSYDNNVPALLPGGAFPGILADQSLAAPRLISRVVAGGMRTRLVLTPTFTGGTAPKFVVSATATARH